MFEEELSFSTHARLKDIVGRGLIISDNIAIIELIKNSKDAGSPSVKIEFAQSKANPGTTELRIIDTGHGMSVDDVKHKWLNIAYSEKRNNKPAVGAYAGNKGIGRFSCDRLGRELTIYSKTDADPLVKLDIDWTKFEVDDQDALIGDVKLIARTIDAAQLYAETGVRNFDKGTILVIRNLREEWGIENLRLLRRELERFIIDPENQFAVSFNHWKFAPTHEINAPIENKIFEELDFRTTSIAVKTVDDGKKLEIELRHDGDFVFRSRELNPYSKLKNVRLNLLFLNQPAKAFFKKRTGYRSVDFGSVFLFLNGFRVFPYGAFGDDWLGIQRRQGQGQKRFFGTRDVVGFIQVDDTEEVFSPVSSREGLVRNLAFQQIASSERNIESSIDGETLYGLFHKALRKLEYFVVEGLDWDRIDRTIGDDNDEELLSGNYKFLDGEKPVLETIDSIVKIRSPDQYIEDVDINLKYLSELARQETREYADLIETLEEKFDGTPIEKLLPAEKRDLSKFISRQAKELAQKDKTNRALEARNKGMSQALQVEERRRIFAEFEKTADQTRIIQLHHQVGLVAGALLKRFDRIVRKYREDSNSFSKEDLISVIEAGVLEIGKIQSVTKLATKADFDVSTNRVNADIVQFAEEYLQNFKEVSHAWGIDVAFSNPHHLSLERSFRPIELTLLIDNIIDNAGKAGAKRLDVDIDEFDGGLCFKFRDNGAGLTDRFQVEQLFEKGISTTSGSGIGLSHARQIVKDLKGEIRIENMDRGAMVTVEFKR